MINKKKTLDRKIENMSLESSFSSYIFFFTSLHLSSIKLGPRNFKDLLLKHILGLLWHLKSPKVALSRLKSP